MKLNLLMTLNRSERGQMDNMDWKYVKPLEDVSLIQKLEQFAGYSFPDSFLDCIKKYNGGRPSHKTFQTERTIKTERTLKRFLSFNPDDRESIWDALEWDFYDDKYIPFAIDNFGNIICFHTETNKIYFINHETGKCEFVADSFDSFISTLAADKEPSDQIKCPFCKTIFSFDDTAIPDGMKYETKCPNCYCTLFRKKI